MGGDSLRFLAGEDVESPRQRPVEGETPRETAARRLADEFERRARDLRDLYERWGPAAAALVEVRAANLEARLDAGAATAFVQVRNSQWGAMAAGDMLGVVARAFGIRQEDIRNATYQEHGDVLSFSATLVARRAPGREALESAQIAPAAPAVPAAFSPPAAAAPGLHVNFTLMGPGSVVGHWPPS